MPRSPANPEDTYDAETWAKLQDNVLEYDEIPDLVHVYNSSISGNLEKPAGNEGKARPQYSGTGQSERQYETHLKDDAKDQGNMRIMEITPCRKSSLEKLRRAAQYGSVQPETVASIQKGEKQITKAAQSLMITYDSC